MNGSQIPDAETREANRLHWLEHRCGVPARYLGATREGWDENWAGSPSPWPRQLDGWTGRGKDAVICLSGEPGKGKTHAAVTVLSRWAKDPEIYATLSVDRWNRFPDKILMIRVPRAVRTLKKHYRRADHGGVVIRGMPAPDFFDHVAETFELVIYDDWGSQPDRENWWVEVEGWIDDRFANQLPTIVTFNPKGIGSPDERIARRVTDGNVIEMPWSAR